MAERSSNKVVIAALLANLGVALVKFIAAGLSGSSAMFAEGIHSSVDTGDALLLFAGLRLAQRPADALHPFGHGKEVFFWSLVVAMMIFGVGGGVTVYEGILRLGSPTELKDPTWSYVVLGAAAIFESISLAVALKSLLTYRRRRMPTYSLFRTIRAAKDPSVFTVVLEDSAALVGLAVAFIGVLLSSHYQSHIFDGVASIVIGLVLTVVALFLGLECRGLLVGERALPEVVDGVRSIVEEQKAVARVGELQTMHIGPDAILLALRLHFPPGMSELERTEAIQAIDSSIRNRYEQIKRVLIDAQSLLPAT